MSLTPKKTGFNIAWDQDGERLYQTGVQRAVLYVKNGSTYGPAVAWNGITSVEESPSGAEANPLYADDIKYLNLISKEEYAFTIGAYTYPDEFAECDGSIELLPGVFINQQKRKAFGFCYTSKIGNDVDGSDYGYFIHLVYNCQAAPSSRSHNAENESPEAAELSWEVSTTPVEVTGGTPTATLDIDCTKLTSSQLKTLEETLFGTGSTPGTFLTPNQIAEILGSDTPSSVRITNQQGEGIDSATVDVAETLTLSAVTVPNGSTVTWSSSDDAVATVSAAGLVEGVAAGTAIITASIDVGTRTYKDTCEITVTTP